jgi:hypothetical protein
MCMRDLARRADAGQTSRYLDTRPGRRHAQGGGRHVEGRHWIRIRIRLSGMHVLHERPRGPLTYLRAFVGSLRSQPLTLHPDNARIHARIQYHHTPDVTSGSTILVPTH